ncbi:MAG: hypothetical protein D6735_03480 [Acidobacteria bacterium]|nr:MAG: hypothetical protein D6735_03480 [Acidobacteriota bacterium]
MPTRGKKDYANNKKCVKKIVPSTGETTIFVYDASGRLVAEYSTIVANSTDAKVAYLTNDHLGSSRILTDANGSVISRRDFHPFGEEIGTLAVAPGSPQPRTAALGYQSDSVRQKFTGYERDNETDLDYAQARMYSYSHGRFTTTDPLYFQLVMVIDPQRFNLYTHTRDNPLRWIDPNGERLYLRGDIDWLKKNVLYKMVGGQENFDKYFEIEDGQVVLKEEFDLSKANEGVQELAGLVSATENYLYFAGTDGRAVADLFQGTRDSKGRLNQKGKFISNRFTCGSNYISGCGTQVGTFGRANSNQPAKLVNGDSVFAVIAYNVNTVQVQVRADYGTLNHIPSEIRAIQEAGVGQVVWPVSFFIHESVENRKFAEQGEGKMDYETAHAHAILREAVIRKALNIGGGFAGAYLNTKIPKKK